MASFSLRDVSIVIPAYNEQDRLPATLAELAGFIGPAPEDFEVVLVDDGSDDATVAVMERWCADQPPGRVLALPHGGKAHAVKQGVLASNKSRVLFMDADLAVPLSEIPRILSELDAGADIAIGSRELAGAVRAGEPGIRRLRGRLFNWYIQTVAVRGFQDTQCGFKAFKRAAAEAVFTRTLLHAKPDSRLRGPSVTAFDVEILYIARRMGLRVVEVPVLWRHVPESKVRPVIDPLRMAVDVLTIRLNALLGRYR